MTQRNSHLSWREKLGYAAGDGGFNFFWKNIEVYLLFFYTDVFGLPAAAAGTMFLVTRIIDAFTDPAMGYMADRTETRWGKFRPYLLWGALPLAAAAVLTYTTPDLDSTGKLLWAYATYITMMVAYTLVNIPYSAMLGVLTANPQERTTLTSLRFVAAFSGGVIVTWGTPKLVEILGAGNAQLGWQLTMAVYAAIACMLFFITFISTKERVTCPPQDSNFAQDGKDLLSNGPWLVLFWLGLVVIITISLRNAASAYYFKYFVERPDLMGNFLTACMIAYAIGAAATPLLTRYWDKRTLLIWLMTAVGVLSGVMYFLPANSIGLIFSFGVLISLALGPKSPLVWSMYADTADYSEWKNNRRATGLIFSSATFALKLGGAAAAAVIGWLLAAMGYQANSQQSAESTEAIVWLVTLIPGAFALLAAWVASRYSLNSQQLSRIQSELEQRA
ncbi:MFS transporter [Neiella sp. HB171785]|uniref:MFS transporter n=1 Tax=Neiella litorisoli TaxID=2771431 RepID=A0A8J6UFL3_9GAMM|nr:MFS transporter [Neiella litorisoli]MBD1388921.1 MFS transporter [Neiella litorisoli]